VSCAVAAARLPPDSHADLGRADHKRNCRCLGYHNKRSRHSNVEGEGSASRARRREVVTTPRDPYWDELGIAWCAIEPEVNAMTPRLEARLRRQSLLITAVLILGVPLIVAGMLLGMLTIWSGFATGTWNFVTRGVAIAVMSSMATGGLWLLLPVRASEAARMLSEMIDLSIARAQRTLLTIRLGLYACGV